MNQNRCHSARGLTLIELLAALVLLALITGAMSSWLMTIARGSRPFTERTQLRAAAEALFERITEYLATGDVNPTEPESDRPSVSGEALTISTRSLGAGSRGTRVQRVYWFDSSKNTISRRDTPSGGAPPCALLGNVVGMNCLLRPVDERQPDAGHVLTLTIRSTVGEQFQQRWLIP